MAGKRSTDGNGKVNEYILQLLTYLNGETLAQLEVNQHQLETVAFEVGKTVAKVTKELLNVTFKHDISRPDYRWNIGNTTFCKSCFRYIDDEELKNICEQIDRTFDLRVASKIEKLRKGVIHGDINEGNIIISSQNEHISLEGIIDFSDIMHSRLVFEVATFMAYMMNKAMHHNLNEPLAAARMALQGFDSVLPLESEEREVLYICIMKRLAVSMSSAFLEKYLGAHEQKLKDLKSISSVAKQLWLKGEKETVKEWRL